MLAFAPVTYFHEEQRFRDSWLWLIVLIPFVVAVSATLAAPRTPVEVTVLVVAVGIGVALLIGLARLGLWPTRRMRLEDIVEFAALHYGLWDSGGWGVHLGLAGMTYNISGNEGVHFRLRNGGRVLVGTQRPGELAAAVAKAQAERAG